MEVETQTLRDTAEQALIGLIQSVADAAAFLKGEIPIAVQELLTYYAVWNALQVVCILAVVIGFWFAWFRKALPWARRTQDRVFDTLSQHPFFIIPSSGALAVSCLAMAGAFGALSEFLKITLAPRIWLIEYAASLVK
jgi:hypothetical protein